MIVTERYYKRFPPGLGHVRVPLSSSEAALAALGLYAACKPRTAWLQHIARAWLRSFGPQALPGFRVGWNPPMGVDGWHTLVAHWRQETGAFEEIAICERRQPLRSGAVLLLLKQGQPLAFVKLRRNDAAVFHEHRVLTAIWTFQPRSFAVPEPFSCGTVSGWDYLVTAALPSPEHRVARNPPLAAIVEEIDAGLRNLSRPVTTPDHWLPMHGDLTPWNLRELPDAGLVLYDWEHSGWGPPDADDVLYRASVAALRNADPGVHHAREAVRYWHTRVSTRGSNTRRDSRLARSLCRALERMQEPRGQTGEFSQPVISA